MTAPVTISGLSGIDTTTVINETLAAAAAPQQAEQTQLANLQTTDTAYQSINSAMAALKTAADSLSAPATWQSTTAASSNGSIVATGSTTALAGTTTTFSVTALAASQTSAISLADPNNASNASNGITITIGAGSSAVTSPPIKPTSNSAADLVTAVNAANIGVKAALITTTTGTILQFASTASGAANSFTVSGLTAGSTNGTPNTLNNLSNAADATITVGAGSGSYSIDSSTNTFADAIPGVTFTVSALTTSPATISVTNDPSVASAAVQDFVTAANSALGLIAANTGQGDLLEGDSLVTSLTEQILSAVSTGSTANGKSFTVAGLDIDSNGRLTFDSTAFAASYNANSQTTQTLVSNLAASLSSIGDQASNTATGSITQALSSDSNQEANLTAEIAEWSTKLADQKTALTNKYAAMDAALSKLQSEQSFLASAFGTSSSNSSSSSSGLSQASVSSSS